MPTSSAPFQFEGRTLSWSDFQSVLRESLSQDLGYTDRKLEKHIVEQASLRAHVLLLVARDANFVPHILMTKRTETVETHKGQMALPGGMEDDADLAQGQPAPTALRETFEEVGILPEEIEIVGALPELPTYSSGIRVTPWIGELKRSLLDVKLLVNPDEIEVAFWIPMTTLTQVETYKREWFESPKLKTRFEIHSYYVNGHRIWGATGAILKNFLDRLRLVLQK